MEQQLQVPDAQQVVPLDVQETRMPDAQQTGQSVELPVERRIQVLDERLVGTTDVPMVVPMVVPPDAEWTGQWAAPLDERLAGATDVPMVAPPDVRLAGVKDVPMVAPPDGILTETPVVHVATNRDGGTVAPRPGRKPSKNRVSKRGHT